MQHASKSKAFTNLVRNSAQPFRGHVYTTCQTSPRSFRQPLTHPLFRAWVTHVCCFVCLVTHAWVFLVTRREWECPVTRWGLHAKVYFVRVGLYVNAATWRDVYDSGRVPFTRCGSHTRGAGEGTDVSRCVCGSLRVLSTVRQARVLAVYFATRFTTITVN